jgi:hypothetical protein
VRASGRKIAFAMPYFGGPKEAMLAMSSRINKSSAVGALAACAVVGATSPVWADSGSSGTPEAPNQATSAQQQAVIAALRAEVDKLRALLKADSAALRDATQAASKEAKALDAAKAQIARLRANSANVTPDRRATTMTVPADDKHFDPAAVRGFAKHRCHHGDDGDNDDHGDFRGNADFRDHGDFGDHHTHHDGGWRDRG